MAELLERGHDPEVVARVLRLVDTAEFKRRQSAPGTKISLKAFGRDRRLPITNRWRESLPSVREGAAPDERIGALRRARRPRGCAVHHLLQAKERGEKWAMLTAYDTVSAAIFEEAGIPVMLVGDSAGNVVLGLPAPCRSRSTTSCS